MAQAIILALLAIVCALIDEFGGRNMFNRPIITGVLTGLILGDLQTGIIIGATLELAFIGMFAVGAAIPPEILTGGILGTAFAIISGNGPETALLLAFPIASLVLILKNLYYILVAPLCLHKADKYAEEGNYKGIELMHIASGLGLVLMYGLVVGISFYAGSEQISKLLDFIPEFVQTGLKVAAGVLPALGFALLGRMLINKKVVPYFFLGFAAIAYLKLPVIAIAVIGTLIALIIVNIDGNQSNPSIANQGGSIDDDEDF
ncbi:PTS mannose/fructose/sorbose/N-acetylgalactosamine transporter subunit IIC [Peribacillus frigoritolerans]|uniref:PTS mannose/fructose/sorbose/N-acetylgalactosamine transporter subunit IIC n=1 Tax=Peribacillus frigoritolerans TaxID=450367 RepID=UPI00399F57D0